MADSEGLGFANTFKDAARNGLRAAGENPGIIGNDQEAFVPAIDYLTKRTLGFLSDGLGGVANTIRKTYEFFFVAIGFALTISYFYIIWF